MKNAEMQERLAEMAARMKQDKGSLGEVGMLFKHWAGESRRQTEIDKKEARHRSGLTKILLALTLAAVVSAVGSGIYGVYNFPDAPLRPAANGYVGKLGKPHTAAEFENYLLWKKALLITFPAVFVFGFAFGFSDNRDRRRHGFPKK
jgi:hypothetical protein